MVSALDRFWRTVATGISFLVFGVGGLAMRTLIFPPINLFVRDAHLRTRIARGIIRYAFRAFIELMRVLGVLKYELKDLHKLDRSGLLILANHPSLIDTVFLMAFVKRADCIVKGALWNNPFTHGPVRAAGYIKNEDGPNLVAQCAASLRAGSNLIVFPEGTRTPRDGTLSFRRGAANIAVRGLRTITPVVIRCAPPTLGKGEKWWHVPAHTAHFVIEVKDDIDVQPFVSSNGNDALAARRLTDHLQNYFTEETQRHVVT